MKKAKRNKAKFVPRSIEVENVEIDKQKYTQEEIELATQLVEQEQRMQATKLQRFSAFWTLISAGYAIISTIAFVVSGWIENTLSYVLIGVLVLYVVVFVALIALVRKNPKKAKMQAKTYRRLTSIFKTIVNLVFLVLSAMSMAGLAKGAEGIEEWIVFVVTFLVALVQFALKMSKFIIGAMRSSVSRRYRVKIVRFVDGEKQNKKQADIKEEKRYK